MEASDTSEGGGVAAIAMVLRLSVSGNKVGIWLPHLETSLY